MILRTIRATVRHHLEPAFLAHVRRVQAESLGRVDGLVDMKMAVRAEGERTIVLGTSTWRDFDALRAFLGDDFDRPRLWDPEGEWIEAVEIEHFELAISDQGVGLDSALAPPLAT